MELWLYMEVQDAFKLYLLIGIAVKSFYIAIQIELLSYASPLLAHTQQITHCA